MQIFFYGLKRAGFHPQRGGPCDINAFPLVQSYPPGHTYTTQTHRQTGGAGRRRASSKFRSRLRSRIHRSVCVLSMQISYVVPAKLYVLLKRSPEPLKVHQNGKNRRRDFPNGPVRCHAPAEYNEPDFPISLHIFSAFSPRENLDLYSGHSHRERK